MSISRDGPVDKKEMGRRQEKVRQLLETKGARQQCSATEDRDERERLSPYRNLKHIT